MPTVILAATTAAAASQPVTLDRGEAHFTCPGIAGAEIATLQKQAADGGWSDYALPDTANIISSGRSGVVAYAAGIYRINKGVTAVAAAVEVSTYGNP